MNLNDLPLSEVVIDTHLIYSANPRQMDSHSVPLKEVEPRKMVQRSIDQMDRACCSLLGGFGFIVDGMPWYGSWENNDPESNRPFFWRIDHWDDGLSWLTGVADLVNGKREASFGLMEFEDCIGLRNRYGVLTISLDDRLPHPEAMPFRTPLIPFAEALLREGKAFLEFSNGMLADLHRRQQVPNIAAERATRIQSRIELIESWAVAKKVELLELALQTARYGTSMAIAWGDLLELMTVHPPQIETTSHREKERITLTWNALPEVEILFSVAMEAAAGERFEWQNPWRMKSLPHQFVEFRRGLAGECVLEVECVEPVPVAAPEYPIYRYDSYILIHLNSENLYAETNQMALCNIHSREWYESLPFDREWLEASMAIAFNQRHWNGEHRRESYTLTEQAIFPPVRLENLIGWFEGLAKVRTEVPTFTWEDGRGQHLSLSRSDTKGSLILSGSELPTKTVETKRFAESLFPELDLLAKACSHLVKLDTRNQLFPWLPGYVKALGLPALRTRLKMALNSHSIAARTAPNQRI